MLGAVAEAADDAHQPLRVERHGSPGAIVPHAEHGSVLLYRRSGRGRRHDEKRHHQLVTFMRGALAAAVLVVAAGCAPPPPPPAPVQAAPVVRPPADWVDSVLASLSVREKAAQMVWPTVLGDYVTTGHPQWRRLDRWIREEKVGGFTMSVGSPLEIALKLNAMQGLSQVPLLIGADLEFGAGYRARGGLVGGIDLGGASLFPPEMAVGATNDTMLAYEQGRVTALEGRAIGIHIAY